MEEASTSYSTSKFNGVKNSETPVLLNVYDLTPFNKYLYWFGLGIFHSGIEVHGKEYGFGAHDFSASGVFEVEPRNCPGFLFRRCISLGEINMSPTEFWLFIENVASEYHGDSYHLISRNCNHFTDDIAWRLTKKRIPGWVNRLARLGACCSCLLPVSLRVTAVNQMPEYHECSEDDMAESVATISPRGSIELEYIQDKYFLSSLVEDEALSFIKERQ